MIRVGCAVALIQSVKPRFDGVYFYKDVTKKYGFNIRFRPTRSNVMDNLLHFWSVYLLAHNYRGCAGIYRRGNTSEKMVNMVMRHPIFCTGYRNHWLHFGGVHNISVRVWNNRKPEYSSTGHHRSTLKGMRSAHW